MPTSRRTRLVSLCLAVGAAACGTPPPAAPPPSPPPPPPAAAPSPPTAAPAHALEIRIRPALQGGEVERLEIGLRFSEPPGESGAPLVLTMSDTEEDEGGWPAAIEGVSASDAEGALAITSRAVDAKDDPHVEWRSERPPRGPIAVSYRVKVSPGVAPAVGGTRAHAGGFEGTGATFLLLPETRGAYHARFAWDLSGLAAGARALTSFGAGAEVEALATPDRIRDAVFTAGPIGRLTIDAGGSRFEGAWLGKPAFDPVEALPWAARVRAFQRAFFHDT